MRGRRFLRLRPIALALRRPPLQEIGPHWFPLELNPADVIEREIQGTGLTSRRPSLLPSNTIVYSSGILGRSKYQSTAVCPNSVAPSRRNRSGTSTQLIPRPKPAPQDAFGAGDP